MSMSKKIALVLSGGGARGLAHVGVIRELEERGYTITSIAGTSMGSIIGGVYASGKMDEFEEWIKTLDRMKVLNLLDFAFWDAGLIKADKVIKTMKEFIDDQNIEDLDLPFCAVAVDLLNRKEVVFRTGSMYDAMRASIAIPSVITPVKYKDTFLVDGGVMNNIPSVHVARTEDDLLLAVNVNARVPYDAIEEEPKKSELNENYEKQLKEFQSWIDNLIPQRQKEESLSYFQLARKTISLMTSHIAQLRLEDSPPDILVEISRDSAETFDFFKAEELIDYGRREAAKALDKREVQSQSQG
ncbi:patatin-like phospholipase family protein [bacterium SCSIO 12741]|nr:patatin-like phospholipase family protein [bacterium SCSIO 12741]